MNFDPDAILRDRLGPPASELLQLVADRVGRGEVAAVVIVTQTRDEKLSLYSAGCTILETNGMLAWAQHWATDGLTSECDCDACRGEGSDDPEEELT